MAEVHITSAVAFVKPERAVAIAADIVRRGLADVPQADDASGRLVVLIEKPSTGDVLDTIDAIRALNGVLAIHLVYQHVEDESVLAEDHS
ncbi:chaperone NapD [Usitatibacter palustris]|uniref:Chaperone NapD n=1 Tax=Usitatibacter palustris TaxID=2732487 RepID=A0A6M4H498_9PROT|nr:chaperone NapD [Usitatibacter palustris]QJR14280.1 Chaperone NapD [Usitatibacter palustris]